MKESIEIVKEFYNSQVEYEWNRMGRAFDVCR